MKKILFVFAVIALVASQGCQGGSSSNVLILSFEYACRENVAFESCEGLVLWNGVIVSSLLPSDYSVHTFTVKVKASIGPNTLQFEAAGVSDSYGLGIDNVQLVKEGSKKNLVQNGGFEKPCQSGQPNHWTIYNNIPAWQGSAIEIGDGKIYNCRWNSQICELDSNGNSVITQYFVFDPRYELRSSGQFPPLPNGPTLAYTLEFDYAARKSGVSSPSTSQGNVLWNNVLVGTLAPSDYSVHHFSTKVILHLGENSLDFDGTGPSDTFGLEIANVKLTSGSNSNNLIVNGNFANSNLGQ